MGNQNGRKPTPQGTPRSPAPSDFSFEQKVRDLFPPSGKGEEVDIAAGVPLVREGEIYGENAAAFFIVRGEVAMQQVCHVVGKGYVTETVATFLPGDLAYSQGVCAHIANHPAKVRLVAAKDTTTMRLTKEHAHWLGSLGRIIEMHGIVMDQILEARRSIRDTAEFDEKSQRLFEMIREKRGYEGTVREFMMDLWSAYNLRPGLEKASEEQMQTIADQERQIDELERSCTEKEELLDTAQASLRGKDQWNKELLDSVADLSRQNERLKTLVQAERAEAAKARQGMREYLETTQTESERQTRVANDNFRKMQTVFLKIQGILAEESVDIRGKLTDEEIELFSTFKRDAPRKLGTTVPPEDIPKAPKLPTASEWPRPDARPTVPGFRKLEIPRPDVRTPSTSDRPTSPAPRPDAIRMPSVANLKLPVGQRTGKWVEPVPSRPRPPIRVSTEEPLNPELTRTADWELPIVDPVPPTAPKGPDAKPDEDDALDPGRTTAFYGPDPFSEKARPAPASGNAEPPDTPDLRRGTIVGVPTTNEEPPKR